MIRYRLTPAPSRPLPLNVRSAGHYRFSAGHREVREPGHFLQVFWSVAGAGQIVVAGKLRPVPTPGVFFYGAGEAHELLAGPAGWEYRWLTFDGSGSAEIPALHELRRVQPAAACPAALFEKLDIELRDPTPAAEARASVLAYEILLHARAPGTGEAATPAGAESADAAKAWLDAHFADHRLNIAELARRHGLHRATLHRVFTRRHGVAPVRYLGRLRLRRGLEMLAGTRLPVAEIASRCGLSDIAYFSKLVSRHTGYSPREYRRRHAHATDAIASHG